MFGYFVADVGILNLILFFFNELPFRNYTHRYVLRAFVFMKINYKMSIFIEENDERDEL